MQTRTTAKKAAEMAAEFPWSHSFKQLAFHAALIILTSLSIVAGVIVYSKSCEAALSRDRSETMKKRVRFQNNYSGGYSNYANNENTSSAGAQPPHQSFANMNQMQHAEDQPMAHSNYFAQQQQQQHFGSNQNVSNAQQHKVQPWGADIGPQAIPGGLMHNNNNLVPTGPGIVPLPVSTATGRQTTRPHSANVNSLFPNDANSVQFKAVNA